MQFVLVSLIWLVSRVAGGAVETPCSDPLVRKEWRSLSLSERKEYISAVQCMMSKEPLYKEYFPLIRDRYDDFVALHANETAGGEPLPTTREGNEERNPFNLMGEGKGIHGNGVFIPWHRYTIHLWEVAIRTECGWKGGQPYWDWNLDTPDRGGSWLKSPVFDPVTGFGGNGAKENKPEAGRFPFTQGGLGGGCILDGPFKNRTLVIGPMGLMAPNNSRCLTRDLNPKIGEEGGSDDTIWKSLSTKNFYEFRNSVEQLPPGISLGETGHSNNSQDDGASPGVPPMEPLDDGGMPENSPMHTNDHGAAASGPPGNFTVHGDLHSVGHNGVGGEMGDFFNSVNDPLFWLHHAGLDRIWYLWQSMDPVRYTRLDGDTTKNPLTLDDMLWVGVAGVDRPIRDIVDPMNTDGKGILCYKYEGNGPDAYRP